jgi:pyrophosphatase PpaX
MILFDLDGTLVDTTDLILRSFEHAFGAHLPGRLPSREELIATFGRSLPATLRDMAAAEGAADPDLLAFEMLATYREFQRLHHDTLIQPFDGVGGMLGELKGKGHRLGLVTSKTEGSARRGLRQFDLEDLFEVGVFHDDTARHKPEPEPLMLAAKRAGVPASEVIYVGDSTHDIVAGRAAGMRTVAVLWGPFTRALLEAEGPDHIVSAPSDLVALVDRLADPR